MRSTMLVTIAVMISLLSFCIPHDAISDGSEQQGSRPTQGILGIEVKLPAPGSFEVKPPVALLAAHDARMAVACCDTYPLSRSVALDTGSFVLPANDEAAVDITAGSLSAEGPAEAGLGK